MSARMPLWCVVSRDESSARRLGYWSAAALYEKAKEAFLEKRYRAGHRLLRAAVIEEARWLSSDIARLRAVQS